MLYRSSFVTFNRMARGLLNTTCQLLINWPLGRGHFGSWRCALEAIAILERWPLFLFFLRLLKGKIVSEYMNCPPG